MKNGVVVNKFGSKFWYKNSKRHRSDGPAVEWIDGGVSYWIDGKRHRLDGPAIIHANGQTEYWIDGERLTEREFNERTENVERNNQKQ